MSGDHVTIIELKGRTHQHKVEGKYCKHVFIARASGNTSRTLARYGILATALFALSP